MSFMRLLAAGRSVKGIRKEPGPYRMNQESLLPRFNAVSKGAPDDGQASETQTVPAPLADAAANDAACQIVGQGEPRADVLKLGWLRRAISGVFRRNTRNGGDAARERRRSVQGQPSLDTVRVVRNDLTDTDSEVASRQTMAGQSAVPHQPHGMVWNRLSARLLRQAAEEFSELQKQRGKLLSQAGNGRGGARGS